MLWKKINKGLYMTLSQFEPSFKLNRVLSNWIWYKLKPALLSSSRVDFLWSIFESSLKLIESSRVTKTHELALLGPHPTHGWYLVLWPTLACTPHRHMQSWPLMCIHGERTQYQLRFYKYSRGTCDALGVPDGIDTAFNAPWTGHPYRATFLQLIPKLWTSIYDHDFNLTIYFNGVK